MDPAMQAHLLPLQQYILEQAKLSGIFTVFKSAANKQN